MYGPLQGVGVGVSTRGRCRGSLHGVGVEVTT